MILIFVFVPISFAFAIFVLSPVRSNRCLVSKLFDVCPRSTFEEIVQQDEVRVAWGTGIAGHVAESGEPVNIPDAYQVSWLEQLFVYSVFVSLLRLRQQIAYWISKFDSPISQDARFNREIDLQTGYRTKALLCMPIKDSSGDVIGVAQVINKLNCERFTENDEKVICVGEHVPFLFVLLPMKCFFSQTLLVNRPTPMQWLQILLISLFVCFAFSTDIFIVSTILWYWSKKCTTLWKISIRSKTESSSIGPGPNDIRGAKYHWTHGATDFNTYAKFNSVPTGSGESSHLFLIPSQKRH